MLASTTRAQQGNKKGSNIIPKCFQNRPRELQNHSPELPKSSRGAPQSSRGPPKSVPGAPRSPNRAPQAPKGCPRCVQRVSEGPLGRHVGTIWASKLKCRADVDSLSELSSSSCRPERYFRSSFAFSPSLSALRTSHIAFILFVVLSSLLRSRWFHKWSSKERERESEGDREGERVGERA